MTKSLLIDRVATQLDTSKAEAGRAVEAVFESLNGVVTEGSRVVLPGFGTFAMKHRKAREGRNLHTGETIQIPARDAMGFKPSKKA